MGVQLSFAVLAFLTLTYNRATLRLRSFRRVVSFEPFIFSHANAVRNKKICSVYHSHSIHLAIQSVTVAGHAADFAQHDSLTSLSMGGPSESQDCHRHPELKRKVYSALQESDEGELSIAVPKEVALKQSGHTSSNNFFNDGTHQLATHSC